MKQIGKIFKFDYKEGEFVKYIPEIIEKGNNLVEILKSEGWKIKSQPSTGGSFKRYYVFKKGKKDAVGILEADEVLVYDSDLEKFISEYTV